MRHMETAQSEIPLATVATFLIKHQIITISVQMYLDRTSMEWGQVLTVRSPHPVNTSAAPVWKPFSWLSAHILMATILICYLTSSLRVNFTFMSTVQILQYLHKSPHLHIYNSLHWRYSLQYICNLLLLCSP